MLILGLLLLYQEGMSQSTGILMIRSRLEPRLPLRLAGWTLVEDTTYRRKLGILLYYYPLVILFQSAAIELVNLS